MGGTLGLLAFMFAFTFQIVGNRYDKRRELVIEEVSDIRTTFLYAGLLPEPYRSGSRQLITRYVDMRVDLITNPVNYATVKTGWERILDSLRRFSEALALIDRSSESYSLFTVSVNQLIRLLNERITVSMVLCN